MDRVINTWKGILFTRLGRDYWVLAEKHTAQCIMHLRLCQLGITYLRWPQLAHMLRVCLLFAIAIVAPTCPQSPETHALSLKRRGQLGTLVDALSLQTRYSIPILGGYNERQIAIDLTNSTYYEVLDTICRAQNDVSYFTLELGTLKAKHEIIPCQWLELPASYDQHFKVAIMRVIRRQSDAPDAHAIYYEISVAVFDPPWLSIDGQVDSEVQC